MLRPTLRNLKRRQLFPRKNFIISPTWNTDLSSEQIPFLVCQKYFKEKKKM